MTTDTTLAAIEALMKDVTPGPWKYEAMGGSSTVLAPTLPPRNDRMAECAYGYGGDRFCIGYPFIDDMRHQARMDFVSFSHGDARFIAAARDLVPALAAELATARAERDEWKRRHDHMADGWKASDEEYETELAAMRKEVERMRGDAQ